ncbi:hypothetical protein J4402_02940 [Candidatus Pacearchaeota archaeon]|nr:hypothetical protein [Candidatus Pacearchaeota archaeon]
MTRRNIYARLALAQRSLRFVDSDNELSNMARVEKDGVYYTHLFLDRYCHGGVVTDKILMEHIGDLESAARHAIGKQTTA